MPETGASPQFSTAEYAPKPGADVCRSCKQSVGGQYYRVNGAMTCPACTDNVRRAVPQDSHGAYSKALLAGAAAAIAGLILYAAVGIITGLIIGYVSLAVGFMVGWAMMKASGGIGGRRYQIAALLFTYSAVSLAAIPIFIAQAIKHRNEQPKPQVTQSATPPPGVSVNPSGPQSQQSPSPAQTNTATGPSPTSSPAPTNAPRQPPLNRPKLLVTMLLIGLASPFLELADPFHGVIGLIILIVGLRMAWKITGGKPKVEIDGPFTNSGPARI